MSIDTSMIRRRIGLFTMIFLLAGCLLPVRQVIAQDQPPEAEKVVFNQSDGSKIEMFTLTTKRLDAQTRSIQVYLPPGYNPEDETTRYPVLYLHDGELLFTPDGNRDTHFDATLSELVLARAIDPLIMVSIYSSDFRWDELGPWYNQNMGMWGGYRAASHQSAKGDAYLDFIELEVKEYVDTYYNTNPADTGIGGFSMGGLISIYAGLTRPHVFNRVMAMSPAIWFAQKSNDWSMENHLLELISTKGAEIDPNVRFYMDIGTDEWADLTLPFGGYAQVWEEGADRVFNELEKYVPANNLILVVEEGGVHEPYAWGGRFEFAMRWLYQGEDAAENQFPDLVTVVPTQLAALLHTPTPLPTATPTVGPVGVEAPLEMTAVVNSTDEPDLPVDPAPLENEGTGKNSSPIFSWVVVILLALAGIGLIIYVLMNKIKPNNNRDIED